MPTCKNDGTTLVARPVTTAYAKHLMHTKNFPFQDAYLHCNQCGENYIDANAHVNPEMRARIEAEVRAEIEAEVRAEMKKEGEG